MAFEAQKCNEPNCKGFVVFDNADFDFDNLETGKSGFYEFTAPKCTECGKQYYVVPHYVVIADLEEEPLQEACISEFERREKEHKVEEEKDPYEKVEKFIKLRGYTYTPEDVLEGYSKKKQGYYTSYTMTDCITNLEHELEMLSSS